MVIGTDEWEGSGEGYQSIFEGAPHAILIHETETKTVIEVNDAACDLLGTNREDLLGAKVGQFSSEEGGFTTERAEILIEKAIEDGPTATEWQITRPDGKSRWVQVQLRKVRIEGTDRIVAYLVDITEQKRRERRLEENNAILRQLTDTTDDVFWLFDADFSELQFINQAYEEVWGRSIDDLRDDPMDFMEGVHPEDRELVREVVGELQAGNSTSTEYRVNPEEDYQRWVSVRGEPIYDDNGEVVRAAGYARDSTDRKEREQALETFEQKKVANNLHVVNDGVDAMTFLRQEGEFADKPRPDIILLDLNLQTMDGDEVLAELQEDDELHSIPVVVLTSSDAEEDIVQSYELNANAYLTKPVDFEGFVEIVDSIDQFWVTFVKLP